MTLAHSKAKASPTKSFFVRMLTRDISLDDCILDLVDNSIDGAWKQSGDNPSSLSQEPTLSDYWVTINLSEEEFRIEDNCGGITLDDAADYAFTFGRMEDQRREEFTVGVYGIGMKRAVFKLGREVRISSTYADGPDIRSFAVPIDVDAWLNAESASWDFDIEEEAPREETGVEVRVRELTEDTSTRFSDPTYARSLRQVLARDYMIPLMRGLRITVNGEAVPKRVLQLREGAEFAPLRETYEDDGVTVEILAGMASPPPDDTDPGDEKKSNAMSGWYVICNGRVVLAADTSYLTGWGMSLPKWHKQYTGFTGVAIFSSENPELLPMTTTKRNVDVSSRVYQRALVRMNKPTRTWINYTNARKQSIDSAREFEKNVEVVDFHEVQSNSELRLPQLVKETREKMANVNYSVPLRELRQLAAGLGDAEMNYRDVGLRSFEYAYADLADEGRE